MTNNIAPKPGILDIRPYKGGEGTVVGMTDVLKLSSNENLAGPGDAARAAFAGSVHGLHIYPSSDHNELRAAISQVHGLPASQIICGAGSDEIITFLCQTYAAAGDEVIHTEHGFSMYRISALAAGATPVEVPERNRIVDVDAILTACNERTKLVFIANPANPTGTMLTDMEVARLAAELPKHIILVLDGAYAEFAPDFDGGAGLVERHVNVFMTRTFSKLYGLGGLRVGWGYGSSSVIDALNRVRGPFNLSQAQQETARAAIMDRDHAEKCRTENTRLRSWLAKALADIGVPSDSSFANFVLAQFGGQAEAEACDLYLKSRGIIVRRVSGYKLPHCLRITVGDHSACRRVVHEIAAFKEAQT